MVRCWQKTLAAIVLLVAFVVEAFVQERVWVRICFWSALYAGVTIRDYGHKVGDAQYEAFLDEFPITRFSLDVGQRAAFGPERTRRTPALIGHFDWLVDHFPFGSWPRMRKEVCEYIRSLGKTADIRREADPSSVYASPHSVLDLVNETIGLSTKSAPNRTLVIAGTDMHLSDALGEDPEMRNATLRALKMRFARIFAEAKDIVIDDIRVMPMGLPENYLRKVNVSSVRHAIENADLKNKTGEVIAAWGKWMRACSYPHLKRDLVACKSRDDARAWASSEVAQGIGVEMRSVPGEQWWNEISRYRFLMAPLGAGVQSSKVIEALLVLTIPIVERHPYPAYEEMRQLGFPIVVVDSWDEVAVPGKLDTWWSELSPRLKSFREKCLSAEGYWRLAAGQDGGCGP